MTEDKKNNSGEGHIGTLLEAIQSDFRVFGENLEIVDRKVDRGFKEVNTKLGRVEERLDGVEERLDGVEERLDGVEERLGRIEEELSVIRTDLKEKVGRDEFRLLESKVLQLEKRIIRK